MEIFENIRPSGGGVIAVFDQNYNLLRFETFDNIIVEDGKTWMRNRASNVVSEPDLTYVGWGNDDTTPDETNTTLNNEVYENQIVNIDNLGDFKFLVQGQLGLSEANGYTISEVGIKDGDHDLFNHSIDFTPEAKTDRKIMYLEGEIEVI